MKVFDITKTQELKEYDLTKGYLRKDTLVTILPEQQEQEEVFHYKTLAEFSNGGKSVEKVVDKEAVPYLPEREEVEDIQVYVEYTEAEIKEIKNQKEIRALEQWFTTYDRVCNEHMRCQRMGVDCHHNIEEWDSLAVQKAERLKVLKTFIA